jgi:DNA polymerase III delta prime subunit
MQQSRSSAFITVLLGALTVLLGLIGNVAANNLPPWLRPFVHFVWPVFALLLAAFLVLLLTQGLLTPPVMPSLSQQRRSRKQLLTVVHHDWIEGVLNQSLHRVARLDLHLEDKPEAVDNLLCLILQERERAPRVLPLGIRISTVFDDYAGALLILGQPGAGKTTLLLELARDLIERAEQDGDHPIPVVFNLSSWTLRRESLVEWLTDELSRWYGVQKNLASHWISTDQILPLLDGLDEVSKKCRDNCVANINEFRKEHGLVPIVVCSRIEDYNRLTERLSLQGAVVIQPVTLQRIQAYLEDAKPYFEGLQTAMNQDSQLWQLLETPLMLSIATMAYKGYAPTDVLVGNTPPERRSHLFSKYIEAMFRRRAGRSRYTREKTMRWLTWLASSMVRYGPSVLHPNVFAAAPKKKGGASLSRWLTPIEDVVAKLFMATLSAIGLALVNEITGGHRAMVGGALAGLLGVLAGANLSRLFFGSVMTANWLIQSGKLPGLGLIVRFLVWLSARLYKYDDQRSHWFMAAFDRFVFLCALSLLVLVSLLFGALFVDVLGLISLLQFLVVLVVSRTRFFPWNWGVRLALWAYGCAPLRYTRFLDYATDLLFLRRVGGRYLFIHRMLMEYFASRASVARASAV